MRLALFKGSREGGRVVSVSLGGVRPGHSYRQARASGCVPVPVCVCVLVSCPGCSRTEGQDPHVHCLLTELWGGGDWRDM